MMFRIRDLKNGLYQLHSKKGRAYEGNMKDIVKKGRYMGLKLDEMLLAIERMFVNDHEIADFYENGKLMYTLKDERKVG